MNPPYSVKLTAELLEAFAGIFLSPLYDEPKPTPNFHREGWELYCSTAPQAAIAAPREHAKSTAFTHDYVLANVLFRVEQYVVIVSSNEEMAIEHLTDISKELRDNEDLVAEFGIKRFVSDAKTDIIVEMDDGHQFRIIARGSGQKMRGRKWMGKRPGLILCDDLEDDEQVESLDRRTKFRKWFFRALKPALRDGGRLRMHGTILQEDSLLARLMKDKTWATLFYKAHESFDDFSHILWPEKFPEPRLRRIRASFIAQFDAAGYAQEYLNNPFDHQDSYLQRGDFLPMKEEDYESPQNFYAAGDLAVSSHDRANRTSFTIGGKDIKGFLLFRDQRVGRWKSTEWLETMFDIQKTWQPKTFFVEKGPIWASVVGFIEAEMAKRQIWINFIPMNPAKDKATRGRSLQKRMRGGGCKFDKRADWYIGFEEELLHFTEDAEALLDDQFDSAVLLSWGLDSFAEEEEDDFYTDEDRAFLSEQARRAKSHGRSSVTGY